MLKPDIDVQLQIQDNLDKLYREYHAYINTNHVKGHQD